MIEIRRIIMKRVTEELNVSSKFCELSEECQLSVNGGCSTSMNAKQFVLTLFFGEEAKLFKTYYK